MVNRLTDFGSKAVRIKFAFDESKSMLDKLHALI